VVRVPVEVREGFSGGTRAAFWSNSKFYASLLLQVSQSTSLFAKIYSSVIQMLLIRLCAKVILGTVHLSNYILLQPGGTFQHKKTPGGTRSQKVWEPLSYSEKQTNGEIITGQKFRRGQKYRLTPAPFQVLESDSCLNSEVTAINFWQCRSHRIWISHQK